MAKNNNKGFSLVEIIVAIAVFAILVIPLTTQLISAIGVNTTSRKKQYAIEKAEGIMEGFKVCSFPTAVHDTIVVDGYVFEKTNSETKNETLPTGEVLTYSKDTYTCHDISIGEKYETYDCEVTVDGLAYAVAAAGYVYDAENGTIKYDDHGDPVRTATATGTIRALDNKQFAIITGATYTGPTGVNSNNLDVQAYNYFNDVKLDLLKNYDVYYSQYLSGTDFFADDTFKKYTTIEVSKDAGEYVIKCIVRYVDSTRSVIRSVYTNNTYMPDTTYGSRSGIVYQQSFEELPPIYLLYMPATRNGIYCLEDYIEIDTSKLSGETPKIYLFESAADIDQNYEDIIVSHFNSSSVGYRINSVNDLVYRNPNSLRRQSDVKVYVYRVNGEVGRPDKDLDVYGNFASEFDSGSTNNITLKPLTDDENNEVYYYDLHVTLTASDGKETEVYGTRGR